MRGYPGSGKSTRAAEIAKENDAVIVNRDQLRKMLLGEWWTGDKTDEDRVTIAEEASVRAYLRAGVSTVVDATHLHAPYLRKWARMASRMGAEFQVVDCHLDVDECKRRVYDRWQHNLGTEDARYIGPDVIDGMAKRAPAAKWPTIKADPPFVVEPVEYVEGLPEAIIVDIDSTVAHIPEGGRSPYDYTRVSDDLPDPVVIQLVRDWKAQNPDGFVLFVSGRDDTCYLDTEKWLSDHGVPVDWLFMRPSDATDSYGNKLADFIVKYNLHMMHIRDRFNVRFVLDDRRQVIDLCWRAMGLKVLDVAGNEF